MAAMSRFEGIMISRAKTEKIEELENELNSELKILAKEKNIKGNRP